MGVTFRIGEAILSHCAADLTVHVAAKGAAHPDAPNMGTGAGQGSSIGSSYGQWRDFCADTGLTELFYGQGWDGPRHQHLPCSDDFHRENPLYQIHPGTVMLCQGDLDFVRAARENWQAAHPDSVPVLGHDNEDETLLTLMWLEFWIGWALKNCNVPVISNS